MGEIKCVTRDFFCVFVSLADMGKITHAQRVR